MKKTFKFFAAALAIVAAASCAKEQVSDSQNQVNEKNSVTLSATFDVDTKATLADKNFVHWTDTDQIGVQVFGKWEWDHLDAPFVIDPSSNDEDPTFASFTGELSYNDVNGYYAVLPATGWDQNRMMFDGFGSQTAVKGSFDPNKHLAISERASGANYTHYVFHNVCALLKVTVGVENVYSIKVEGSHYDKYGDKYTVGAKPYFLEQYLSVSGNYNPGYWYPGTNAIELSNKGAALETGATYYIVVPHVTVMGFKVSLCDANGNTLVTKSKTSDFKIERNKIYDLGTFELPKESVEVSTSSLSLAAKNGSASFKVVADVNWTVTSSASWLTVSPSSGTSTSGTTVNVVASENTNTQTRTATLTIRGKDLTRTISVTQEKAKSYRYVKQLSHATELQDGKLYVIAYMKDAKMFWTEQDMWVKHKYFSSNYLSDNQYLANEVFKFHKVSVSTSIGTYNTTVVGMWESMSNGKYMSSTPAMNSTSNDASYISIGQWDGSSKDFDMYIGTSDANTLYYDGTKVAKGSIGTAESSNRGQKARKWYIYEVTER